MFQPWTAILLIWLNFWSSSPRDVLQESQPVFGVLSFSILFNTFETAVRYSTFWQKPSERTTLENNTTGPVMVTLHDTNVVVHVVY